MRKNVKFKIDGHLFVVYKNKMGAYMVDIEHGLKVFVFPSLDDVKKMVKAVSDGKCSPFNYDHSFNY